MALTWFYLLLEHDNNKIQFSFHCLLKKQQEFHYNSSKFSLLTEQVLTWTLNPKTLIFPVVSSVFDISLFPNTVRNQKKHVFHLNYPFSICSHKSVQL